MNQQKFHETLRESQQAKADLWAWGSVIDLLEGTAAPCAKHHQRAVSQVVKTAKLEIQKALKRMDSADAKLEMEFEKASVK